MKEHTGINDCYYLGHVSKKQGYNGWLIVFLDVDEPMLYRGLDQVFIELATALVPFIIKELDIKDKGYARLKLEGVNDEAAAESLTGQSLFLPLEILPEPGDGEFYLHEIEDYQVQDKQYGEIGRITEVVQNAVNPYAIVSKDNGEVIIPFQPAFLRGIDRKNKLLKVDLPKGMIDLNL